MKDQLFDTTHNISMWVHRDFSHIMLFQALNLKFPSVQCCHCAGILGLLNPLHDQG